MSRRKVRSSANFLSYDLRPSKQAERRIILDLLRASMAIGLDVPDYRYIGMGANRFYDYILFHKYLGFRNMISLERDKNMYKRALYNVPYKFIDVRNSTTAKFIEEDSFAIPSVIWFDYDGGLSRDVAADIALLAPKLNPGDFFFVTTFGWPPGAIADESDEARLAWCEETFGDAAAGLTVQDVENQTFPSTVARILCALMRNSFAIHPMHNFEVFLRAEYSDSTPMITVGGCLLTPAYAAKLSSILAREIPFLSQSLVRGEEYRIRAFNLTEKERMAFDRVVTDPVLASEECVILEGLGFSEEEFNSYRELLRYIPRYFESIV